MRARYITFHSSQFIILLTFIAVVQLLGCAPTSKVLSIRPNEHMEIGWTPRSVFQSPVYAWFDSGYQAYQPTKEYVDRLRQMKDSTDIFVVYGTWCSDSRDELPRFFKVMDSAYFPADRIKLVAIDRAKQLPPGIAKEYDIKLVPTFIVRYRGVEVGRIIETVKHSFEQDIVEILVPFYQ